jgi:hypothetical protein
MGKRQTRIFNSHILAHAGTLIGTEANVLLVNQTTVHGVIESMKEGQMTIRDMRLRTRTIALETVEEIMLDNKTLY